MPEIPLLPLISAEPLSVVLLAHQAAGHAENLLSGWVSTLERLGRPWEILVADDGSSDSTAEKAERIKGVRVLRQADPAEGRALKAALEACRHPLIFTARLLPRYQPSDLSKFLSEPRAKRPDTNLPCPEIDLVHLVTSYRTGRPVPPFWSGLGVAARTFQKIVLGTSPTPLPGWLGLPSHLAGVWYRILFGIRNRDASTPCRLMRREIVPRLALQSEGSFVHVEILAKATFLGLILSEDIPLTERKRGTGADPTTEYPEDATRLRRDYRNLLWQAEFGRAEKSPEESVSRP